MFIPETSVDKYNQIIYNYLEIREIMSLTTIKGYAEKYGKKPESIYQKYSRGYFSSAKKFGNQIIMDDAEPLPVYRARPGEEFPNPNIVRMKETRRKRGETCGTDNPERICD